MPFHKNGPKHWPVKIDLRIGQIPITVKTSTAYGHRIEMPRQIRAKCAVHGTKKSKSMTSMLNQRASLKPAILRSSFGNRHRIWGWAWAKLKKAKCWLSAITIHAVILPANSAQMCLKHVKYCFDTFFSFQPFPNRYIVIRREMVYYSVLIYWNVSNQNVGVRLKHTHTHIQAYTESHVSNNFWFNGAKMQMLYVSKFKRKS